MKRFLYLIYAAIAYILAIANLAYLIGFLTDFGVPKGISDGKPAPAWIAVLVDTGLILLFGLHHSITARTSFKQWWIKVIPAPIERATYLYMTAIMTAGLMILWRPLPYLIWDVQQLWLVISIYVVFLGIAIMMMIATFQFGHFSFFGLAQAWQNYKRSLPNSSGMTARYLYAVVRHPISLGWMILPLCTPSLTVGHLVFSFASIAYIILATPYEEADLISEIGEDYHSYRRRVPAFLPFIKPKTFD